MPSINASQNSGSRSEAVLLVAVRLTISVFPTGQRGLSQAVTKVSKSCGQVVRGSSLRANVTLLLPVHGRGHDGIGPVATSGRVEPAVRSGGATGPLPRVGMLVRHGAIRVKASRRARRAFHGARGRKRVGGLGRMPGVERLLDPKPGELCHFPKVLTHQHIGQFPVEAQYVSGPQAAFALDPDGSTSTRSTR